MELPGSAKPEMTIFLELIYVFYRHVSIKIKDRKEKQYDIYRWNKNKSCQNTVGEHVHFIIVMTFV